MKKECQIYELSKLINETKKHFIEQCVKTGKKGTATTSDERFIVTIENRDWDK